MTRYRPVACSGRKLDLCLSCLRYVPLPPPHLSLIAPEVLGDRCADHFPGGRRGAAMAAPSRGNVESGAG